ncbi:hypothetical protein NDU88_007602 [Pleurodeles waltl]|uniref:Uncharacterized protein n=1 Tax=Pleurodeles waltl TaxID=8319 RepID=A0AAV7NU29_PLEWA|nr:hypothetical protein NDU88_007602 [Pleurodeles waltl]
MARGTSASLLRALVELESAEHRPRLFASLRFQKSQKMTAWHPRVPAFFSAGAGAILIPTAAAKAVRRALPTREILIAARRLSATGEAAAAWCLVPVGGASEPLHYADTILLPDPAVLPMTLRTLVLELKLND